MSICYCNGSFLPIEEASLPVTDLAVQRGVGVFEAIRTYSGRPFALQLHLQRLERSADRTNIARPAAFGHLEEIIDEGIRRSGEQELLVKPYITGGDVNESGTFPEPRLFVLFEPLHVYPQEYYRKGVALLPMEMERPVPGVKSIDYMAPWAARGGRVDVLEGIYVPAGEFTESTSSSVFFALEGKLVTAPPDRVLPGITRGLVLEIAREAGFVVEERCLPRTELPQVREAFLTASIKEVMPVVRIGDRSVGNGLPGPVTAHLHRLYRRAVNRMLG
ncbi:MAG: aminotransferase class IV [Synergistales bacterium]|nr:aminotransferase class IV [Synergistales bacterium]